jgi:hypothetical protein
MQSLHSSIIYSDNASVPFFVAQQCHKIFPSKVSYAFKRNIIIFYFKLQVKGLFVVNASTYCAGGLLQANPK